MSELTQNIERAAVLIAAADSLIITAGAGMGVDSGLPDFRGGQGFWGEYPALGRAGISFEEIASPQAFVDTPELAWGFYGHRLRLYQSTEPHKGFRILLDIATRLSSGAFVFTSNVDGQFQKAWGLESRVVECHGSIHYLQCLDRCGEYVWPVGRFQPEVDHDECRLLSALPTCNHCQGVARPNILMFSDWNWLANRKYEQQLRYRMWRSSVSRPVVVEIGAGTAIPSVRQFGEEQGCPLIRINPREELVDRASDVGLPCGGLAGLEAIADALERRGFFERPVLDLDEIDDVEL